jgi:hypothetical protein
MHALIRAPLGKGKLRYDQLNATPYAGGGAGFVAPHPNPTEATEARSMAVGDSGRDGLKVPIK